MTIFRSCSLSVPLIYKMEIIKKVIAMHKIINVNVLQNYQVKLKFDDGQQGIADLSHLVGKGVFSIWNDYNAFQNVRIGSSGELMWSDQIDICPDSLYLKITNQKPEDLFPNLKHTVAYA
jgi:hypothetical protein